MLWFLYNLLFPVVFICMLPKFIARMLKRGGYGQHFEQRIGHFGRNTKARLREHQRVWVHAVSVGEIYVALRFIRAYRSANPYALFALSTTTSTGHTIARRELDPRDVLFYFPVDLPPIVRKVLRIVNPSRIVLVEGEFWPNLIRQANGMDIPISLINGRLSERSYKGYRKLKPLTTDVLRRIRPICVQGKVDAERMIGIGAPPEHVHTMGTVKFDVAERDPAGEETARQIVRGIGVADDAIVLLGGSTWPGEEDVLCSIYKRMRETHPDLYLIMVPRHVERSEEVVQVFEKHGLSYERRSHVDLSRPGDRPDVLLVDTTGELRNFYSVADLIFVGKSLTQHGGQNPIEPAMYGKAVIMGPNMENFPVVMEVFLTAKAVLQVASADGLADAIEHLIAAPAEREQLGLRAAQVVERSRGVIEKTVQLLDRE